MKSTRDYRIEIRLNKTEYDMLCNKVDKSGLDLSKYIRKLIIGQRILSIPLDNDYFIKMYESVQRCISALTRWEWKYKTNEKINTDEVLFLFREIYNMLIEIHDKYSYNEWKNKDEADRVWDDYTHYLSEYNKAKEENYE